MLGFLYRGSSAQPKRNIPTGVRKGWQREGVQIWVSNTLRKHAVFISFHLIAYILEQKHYWCTLCFLKNLTGGRNKMVDKVLQNFGATMQTAKMISCHGDWSQAEKTYISYPESPAIVIEKQPTNVYKTSFN